MLTPQALLPITRVVMEQINRQDKIKKKFNNRPGQHFTQLFKAIAGGEYIFWGNIYKGKYTKTKPNPCTNYCFSEEGLSKALVEYQDQYLGSSPSRFIFYIPKKDYDQLMIESWNGIVLDGQMLIGNTYRVLA